ncbi:MAG: Rieske 2Fe-2S domain-containing protein [Dermatophilaceae bacterium]
MTHSDSEQSTTPDGDDASVPSTEVVYHRVARSGQIPEGYVRRFYVDDLECAVARLRGSAYATSNYCTHLDCLLSSGKLVDDGICCSCHGSVFDLETGEPIYPPATEAIAVYPVREQDGEIFVGVSQADIADGGPRRRKLRRD